MQLVVLSVVSLPSSLQRVAGQVVLDAQAEQEPSTSHACVPWFSCLPSFYSSSVKYTQQEHIVLQIWDPRKGRERFLQIPKHDAGRWSLSAPRIISSVDNVRAASTFQRHVLRDSHGHPLEASAAGPHWPTKWLRAHGMPEAFCTLVKGSAAASSEVSHVSSQRDGRSMSAHAFWAPRHPGVLLVGKRRAQNDGPASVGSAWQWQLLHLSQGLVFVKAAQRSDNGNDSGSDGAPAEAGIEPPRHLPVVESVLLQQQQEGGTLAVAVNDTEGNSCLVLLDAELRLMLHVPWHSKAGGRQQGSGPKKGYTISSISWLAGTRSLAVVDARGHLAVVGAADGLLPLQLSSTDDKALLRQEAQKLLIGAILKEHGGPSHRQANRATYSICSAAPAAGSGHEAASEQLLIASDGLSVAVLSCSHQGSSIGRTPQKRPLPAVLPPPASPFASMASHHAEAQLPEPSGNSNCSMPRIPTERPSGGALAPIGTSSSPGYDAAHGPQSPARSPAPTAAGATGMATAAATTDDASHGSAARTVEQQHQRWPLSRCSSLGSSVLMLGLPPMPAGSTLSSMRLLSILQPAERLPRWHVIWRTLSGQAPSSPVSLRVSERGSQLESDMYPPSPLLTEAQQPSITSSVQRSAPSQQAMRRPRAPEGESATSGTHEDDPDVYLMDDAAVAGLRQGDLLLLQGQHGDSLAQYASAHVFGFLPCLLVLLHMGCVGDALRLLEAFAIFVSQHSGGEGAALRQPSSANRPLAAAPQPVAAGQLCDEWRKAAVRCLEHVMGSSAAAQAQKQAAAGADASVDALLQAARHQLTLACHSLAFVSFHLHEHLQQRQLIQRRSLRHQPSMATPSRKISAGARPGSNGTPLLPPSPVFSPRSNASSTRRRNSSFTNLGAWQGDEEDPQPTVIGLPIPIVWHPLLPQEPQQAPARSSACQRSSSHASSSKTAASPPASPFARPDSAYFSSVEQLHLQGQLPAGMQPCRLRLCHSAFDIGSLLDQDGHVRCTPGGATAGHGLGPRKLPPALVGVRDSGSLPDFPGACTEEQALSTFAQPTFAAGLLIMAHACDVELQRHAQRRQRQPLGTAPSCSAAASTQDGVAASKDLGPQATKSTGQATRLNWQLLHSFPPAARSAAMWKELGHWRKAAVLSFAVHHAMQQRSKLRRQLEPAAQGDGAYAAGLSDEVPLPSLPPMLQLGLLSRNSKLARGSCLQIGWSILEEQMTKVHSMEIQDACYTLHELVSIPHQVLGPRSEVYLRLLQQAGDLLMDLLPKRLSITPLLPPNGSQVTALMRYSADDIRYQLAANLGRALAQAFAELQLAHECSGGSEVSAEAVARHMFAQMEIEGCLKLLLRWQGDFDDSRMENALHTAYEALSISVLSDSLDWAPSNFVALLKPALSQAGLVPQADIRDALEEMLEALKHQQTPLGLDTSVKSGQQQPQQLLAAPAGPLLDLGDLAMLVDLSQLAGTLLQAMQPHAGSAMELLPEVQGTDVAAGAGSTAAATAMRQASGSSATLQDSNPEHRDEQPATPSRQQLQPGEAGSPAPAATPAAAAAQPAATATRQSGGRQAPSSITPIALTAASASLYSSTPNGIRASVALHAAVAGYMQQLLALEWVLVCRAHFASLLQLVREATGQNLRTTVSHIPNLGGVSVLVGGSGPSMMAGRPGRPHPGSALGMAELQAAETLLLHWAVALVQADKYHAEVELQAAVHAALSAVGGQGCNSSIVADVDSALRARNIFNAKLAEQVSRLRNATAAAAGGAEGSRDSTARVTSPCKEAQQPGNGEQQPQPQEEQQREEQALGATEAESCGSPLAAAAGSAADAGLMALPASASPSTVLLCGLPVEPPSEVQPRLQAATVAMLRRYACCKAGQKPSSEAQQQQQQQQQQQPGDSHAGLLQCTLATVLKHPGHFARSTRHGFQGLSHDLHACFTSPLTVSTMAKGGVGASQPAGPLADGQAVLHTLMDVAAWARGAPPALPPAHRDLHAHVVHPGPQARGGSGMAKGAERGCSEYAASRPVSSSNSSRGAQAGACTGSMEQPVAEAGASEPVQESLVLDAAISTADSSVHPNITVGEPFHLGDFLQSTSSRFSSFATSPMTSPTGDAGLGGEDGGHRRQQSNPSIIVAPGGVSFTVGPFSNGHTNGGSVSAWGSLPLVSTTKANHGEAHAAKLAHEEGDQGNDEASLARDQHEGNGHATGHSVARQVPQSPARQPPHQPHTSHFQLSPKASINPLYAAHKLAAAGAAAAEPGAPAVNGTHKRAASPGPAGAAHNMSAPSPAAIRRAGSAGASDQRRGTARSLEFDAGGTGQGSATLHSGATLGSSTSAGHASAKGMGNHR